MKRICKIAWFTLMLTVLLAVLSGCGKTKLDYTEGVSMEFSGVNGKGRAELIMDEDDPSEMVPRYLRKLVADKKISQDDWQTIMAIGDAITYDIDKTSGLSNGDTVTVTFDVDKEALEALKLTAEPATLTFQVKGLTEVTEITPFQDFQISFDGISPDAYVKEYTKQEEIDGTTVYYSIEETNSSLRDGQEITIRAKLTDNEAYHLTEETKSFTVSGVDKYISDISELQSGTLSVMREKADALLSEQIQNWQGYFSYSGFEFVGYEFWNRQEDSIMGNPNAVYLYYKINANDNGTPFDTYYYVGFNSVLQHLDGTQEVDLGSIQKPSIGLYEELKEYPTLESRTGETHGKFGGNYNIQDNFE